MPLVDHVDLVVSSLERSLPFYRGLLAPLGYVGVVEQEGERGEPISYVWGPDMSGSLGLRERQSGEPVPDRYAVGLHHLAFEAPSRGAVDEAAAWARVNGATIEGEPGERHYTPGYYATFLLDPDGIKLEVVHRPRPFSLSFARGLVRGAGSIGARLRRRATPRDGGTSPR
jgi:catechol 2,3-dioxygenase-like lactoylglutathione lyase family enzyme